MCVVELNVSLLPCKHRWYHLVRTCDPSKNLSNCGSKLALEGWEIKCDFCPYCSGWNLNNAEYRLVGSDRTPSVGGLSRSPSSALSSTRRDSRRSSLARSESSTSVTMLTASEKNKAINARIDAYLSTNPDRILALDTPSSASAVREEAGASDSDRSHPPSPTTTDASRSGSVQRDVLPPSSALLFHRASAMQGTHRSGSLRRTWKKHSKKLGMGLFK